MFELSEGKYGKKEGRQEGRKDTWMMTILSRTLRLE
jgi:hypothetical protein